MAALACGAMPKSRPKSQDACMTKMSAVAPLSCLRALLALTAGGLVFLPGGGLEAQVVLAPPTPQVGSSNTVSADPPVPRPHTQPCTVQLFQNLEFADFNIKSFSYTPPSSCPGPWAKVVFTADFTVTAGRQFDRTAKFFLGGANLYFGTTAEPRAALSPSWHVESDVTDLSAVFKSAQSGFANIGNFVGVSGGVDYTGIIFADAQLQFYPASFQGRDPVTRVPDVVIGLQADNDATTLSTTASQLSKTLTLPTNVESAYLDVVAQSQSNDEFWYLCVPNDLAAALQSCGGTGFRETEVSIDGQAAGVAPVYPWIYTGGIDPFLWEPIPGVQTLNFKPYRVDLTPFAGLLADGQQHTVALNVFNADSYFAATATLLLYTDPGSERVTGGVLRDDLASEPTPKVTESVTVESNGDANGSVIVACERQYEITGYVKTSHGIVETTVKQASSFKNSQNFTINATTYIQDLSQSTTVQAATITRTGSFVTEDDRTFSYPFTFHFGQTTNADGSLSSKSVSNQRYLTADVRRSDGFTTSTDETSNEVASDDTLSLTSAGVLTAHTGASSQNYFTNDSRGSCYSRKLTSVNSVLTGYTDGGGCPR
jgi:Peptide N-acetyl-beta-D-glucosaminyl asparaginase amidase A